MSDLLRKTFQMLLAQGMTPLEALREFDREEWNKAVREEIEIYGPNPPEPSLLDLSARANREGMNERDLSKALELWLAGWKSESVTKESDIFQWQWRRPPRMKNSLGMKFLSTDQAYNALKKEKK